MCLGITHSYNVRPGRFGKVKGREAKGSGVSGFYSASLHF